MTYRLFSFYRAFSPMAAGAFVAALAGCHEDRPLAPEHHAAATSYLAVALDCVGARTTVSCGQRAIGEGHTLHDALDATRREAALHAPARPKGFAPSAAADVIIGGQGRYVQVTSTNVSYDGTQTLSANVTVQDLTTQPFGTADGVTPSANGIQVFFDQLPTVTAGSGSVTVANPTGTGTFTQSGEPYFQYPGLLPSNATTAPLQWQFAMPSTVTNFAFTVYVSTQLPDESVSAIMNIPAHTFTTLSAGQADGCAVRPGSHLYCWGFNNYSALGVGQTPPVTAPEGVLGLVAFGAVAAGTEFSCALASQVPYCWGDNARGQVGDGTTTDRAIPTAVSGGITFTQIVTGGEFACGLDGGGKAYCWGANSFGQLGDGTTSDRSAPSTAHTVGSGMRFAALTAGAYHACGLTSAGAAYCWGGNTEGALGQSPDAVPHASPIAVGGPQFTDVAAGDNFTCGIGTDGNVYCWGANRYGALGDGTTTDHSTPAQVTGVSGSFTIIAAGAFHVCAATSSGATYCWGDNSSGQIGSGAPTTTDLLSPTSVSGAFAFTTLAAGFSHTCAIAGDGTTYCWGDDTVGELGNGTTTSSNTPVAVSLP